MPAERPPRTLLLDVTRLVVRRLRGRLPTGVDRVALEHVRAFGDEPGTRAWLRLGRSGATLPAAASRRLFAWLLSPPGTSVPWATLAGGTVAGLVAAPAAGTGDLLLNPGHSGLEHDGYARRLRARGVRLVCVIHDLIPITHAETCRPGEADRHARRLRHAVAWSALLLPNSGATRDVLRDWARAQGLALPRTVVARLAPGLARPATPLRPPAPADARPWFVVVGTIEGRKNHWLLLQVWRRLVERHGPRAPRLVVVGQRGWECEAAVDLLERCAALRGHVEERARCTDAELAALLAGARALLFPSLAEGYGLPLVEALAAGVPVIASDLPVFHELAGDGPDYADPLDGPAWLDLVEAYATDPSPRREAQRRRIDGWQAPTWAEHVGVVRAALDELPRA